MQMRMRAPLRPRRAGAGAALLLALLAGCGGPAPITDCVARGDLVPICRFRNPEDLEAVGTWLLISEFAGMKDGPGGGGLIAFRPGDGARQRLWPVKGAKPAAAASGVGAAECPGPPDAAAFSPHGLGLSADAATLLVVNHGGREAVEFFSVSPGADAAYRDPTSANPDEDPPPRLAWQGCVPLPERVVGNDVAALPDGGFVVSHFGRPGFTGTWQVARGENSGLLLLWDAAEGLRAVQGSGASGPNGVVASADGSQFFYAEWALRRVVRVSRTGAQRLSTKPLGFRPDNLTWREDGKLLVAGHRLDGLGDMRACFGLPPGDDNCGLPSVVALLDPESLEHRVLLDHDPARVSGAATVALQHGEFIWIGTFAGDRLVRMAVP
ncbi:MAG: hypothetical protein OXU92_04245 [Deltaproteobacteria bacterium]|nr:hypothetical protein [Deltaproteobacteria bacterium]MDD9872068.1 hypothetical protein [Deltaproteobacteria bacterium]